LTRRSLRLLSEEAANGFNVTDNNREAIYDADVIVLAVLPQQLKKVLEEIAPAVSPEKQVVVSVISGVTCADVREKLGNTMQVIRAMPNTAIAIGQSMTCIASDNASDEQLERVTRMFETVGSVVTINED